MARHRGDLIFHGFCNLGPQRMGWTISKLECQLQHKRQAWRILRGGDAICHLAFVMVAKRP